MVEVVPQVLSQPLVRGVALGQENSVSQLVGQPPAGDCQAVAADLSGCVAVALVAALERSGKLLIHTSGSSIVKLQNCMSIMRTEPAGGGRRPTYRPTNLHLRSYSTSDGRSLQ
jgi:hypothetical protein